MKNYNRYNPTTQLVHSGVLGMKWGIRRYQNPDGSLTEEGRRHYGVGASNRAKMYTQVSGKTLAAVRKYNKQANKIQARYDKKVQKRDAYDANHPDDQKNAIQKIYGKALNASIRSDANYANTLRFAAANGKQEVDEIIKRAMQEGYKVSATSKKNGELAVQDILSKSFFVDDDSKVKIRKTRYSIA